MGRISFSQVEASQRHLALFDHDTEVGRIPLDPNVTGDNYVGLRDRDANLGRVSW